LRTPEVELVSGDLLAPASLDKAARGVEVVYHLAGATLVLRPEDYQSVNVTGTQNLAEACARQLSPPRFIHVSSLAASGPSPNGRPVAEDGEPAPVSAYGRSKLASEQTLRAFAHRLPVTIARPPAVFGPGDRHTLGLLRAARCRVMVVPGTKSYPMSWLYVRDLIEALLRAGERGRHLTTKDEAGNPGQGVYFVALDERATLVEFATLGARILGARRVAALHLPCSVCKMLARMNDVLARSLSRPRLLTSDKMCEALAGPWICAADKARRELGFECQTGLEEGLRLAVAWYRAQRWL
jgi:nucleoside-diphosphate-sugar epimerase